MFKSALLALKPSAAQNYVIELAVGVARSRGWELTACTVIDPEYLAPAESTPIGAGAYKKERDERRISETRQAARAAVEACRAACTKAGLACHQVVREGDTVAHISEHVAEHDLLLVGHSLGDDLGDESLLYRLLKHSPRPALVFPRQPAADGSVVAAYDGSFQAARALASFAQSGLGAGREVHVVTCHEDRRQGEAVGEVAGRFLARHGLSAAVHVESGGVAEALLAQVAQRGAGLLVMGAFGKGAVHEFIFGSVTQRILHGLAVPVFLDH